MHHPCRPAAQQWPATKPAQLDHALPSAHGRVRFGGYTELMTNMPPLTDLARTATPVSEVAR